MLLYFVLLFSLTCLVKSDNDKELKWTTTNNVTIEMDITEYCINKKCLVKCCPPGQYLKRNATKDHNITFPCAPFTKPDKAIAGRLKDLSELNRYAWNWSGIETSTPYFDLIQNDFFMNDVDKTYTYTNCDFKIFQNGSLYSSCTLINKTPALKYCVDFVVARKINQSNSFLKLVCKVPTDTEDPYMAVKQIYIATGMLISTFFMLLVLFVYSVLPYLRNIAGMVLMAYLVSLIIGFAIKAAQLIYLTAAILSVEQCENTSPVLYYFILASFFWLNIMSFDLWWTIRGSCKQRQIHRQGERVKFLWYSLYAWGVPALLTILLVIIDKKKLITSKKYKLPFSTCFAEVAPSRLYVHLPIGIMTIVNCIMFAMTAINIWKIKSKIINAAESSNTKKNENRFVIYIKLSVLMGVNWVLEQLPPMHLVLHIIVNFFTIFLGVGIFYVFVCKKSTIKMLCKRLNIRNHYVDGLQASQYSASGRNAPSTRRFSNRKGHMPEKYYDKGTELSTLTSS